VNISKGNLVSFKLVSSGTVTAGLPQIVISYAVGTSNVGVTSIATSGPITGGPITTTGTIGISNASNSAVGAFECDTNSITCNGSGVGSEVATTYYSSPWLAASAVPLAANNDILGVGFTVPTPTTFTNIYVTSNTVDGSGNYSMAVANSSGTIICNASGATHIPAAGSIWTATGTGCASTTAYPGNVYVLLWTGTSTTGKLDGNLAAFPVPFYAANVSGCTSSSGVISGTCTISLSITANLGAPSFMLH
jgi:hypothetical protein